eukprot:Gregarina_sp_Pseudo_9__5934@NODE_952_length_2037_cov_19_610611_g893_i0_p1_GENE_NODE_952_length_2037_cov_19_610611_g893_i0NODE_952_length_2037_cov_19_610611_g893_i0_p1_ORF_typecomplete_len607_score145_81ANAPC4_WD40/PF12894_7/6_4e11ANAPC4_WD40/PF12894_7/0_32ANAPC4_WD40/PF12894_7/8_1e08ANAPC4_WD40/PF12894_7/2_2e05WD40/PF00400_32/9e03WD40/PF00400_32/0_088WD40/PF00400_32/0_69WD40/PF00400_32/1_3e02WD40/PF00400_32/0_068WD40/PF00400_32/0_16WD40/PF00400_32/1_1e08Ge1_WD40/PF16529_5/0_28Ge1_WD40/PF16529_5/
MIEGGPIFTLELGCANATCDPRCPCQCHTFPEQDSGSVDCEPRQTVHLLTQEGFEFAGEISNIDDDENGSDMNGTSITKEVGQEKNDTGQETKTHAKTDTAEKLRYLLKAFPIRSRPHFETRRRRRVPKSSSAVLSLTSPIVDDFYLNLLDWSSRNIVTIASGSSMILMRPRQELKDFEILTKLHNPLTPIREEAVPPPLPSQSSHQGAASPSPVSTSQASPSARPPRHTTNSSSTINSAQLQADSDYTSVKWSGDGLKLAVGCQHGMIEVWDPEIQKVLRVLGGHTQRVGTLDWVPTHPGGGGPSDLLTSGSRDKIILCHDLRLENSIVSVLDRHKQEVCGLKWRATCSQDRASLSPTSGSVDLSASAETRQEHFEHLLEAAGDAETLLQRDWTHATGARPFSTRHARQDARHALYECLRDQAPDVSGRLGGAHPKLASGGNDNKVYIWDLGYQNPIARLSVHQAAVKALTWAPCPIPLLLTGGGTNDRSIRLWDIACKRELATCETESQVCNLFWSPATLEVISSHGYTLNQVNVWDLRRVNGARGVKPLGFRKLATLTGHTARVLYMAGSPDGTQVCTAAGDGSVRLWSAFMDATDDATETES